LIIRGQHIRVCWPEYIFFPNTKEIGVISGNPGPGLAALARLEQGQQDLRTDLQDLQKGRQDLQNGQQDLQMGQQDLNNIMARIDRLQDTVTSMNTDIAVNFCAVQYAERRRDDLREEVATLTNLVFGIERQIQHIHTGLRDLRGGI